MKYLRQFCIILLVSALGEGLHILLPLPVPASVYGLVLMLGALASGILKLEQVEEAADFLVEIMPVMFVPAGVGLLEAWGDLASCCAHNNSDNRHCNGSYWTQYSVCDQKGQGER